MRRQHLTWLAAGALTVAACGTSNDVAVERSTNVTSTDSSPASTSSTNPTPTIEAAPVPDTVLTDIDPAATGADGVGDSFYPGLGNGGYDVEHYRIELAVDVDANTIDATTTIDAQAVDALGRFNLDLSGLDVEKVLVDGVPADFARDGDELEVTPASPLVAGNGFTVEVVYAGQPEPVVDPGVPFDTVGWQSRDGVIYVASEPSGAMSWFPGNNHPSDKATFEFVITTDVDLLAIANGVQVDRVDNGDGTATTTWEMNDPMTTYLAAVYVGDFERRDSVTDDGLPIRNFFPPALADDLDADFALTADVIAFYEDLFAAPYPFDEYGSIVLPFGLGFALENQTISVHGLDATDSTTIAHEILHQWMGNSVTLADWQDIWMNEGFATYLSYLYFEDRGLSADLDPAGMYAALRGGSDGPAEVPIEELFGISVYLRGALALHALRVELGDDDFRTIVQTTYARNAGEGVSTDEFRDVVTELAGPDALGILDPWLYGPDLPPFPS